MKSARLEKDKKRPGENIIKDKRNLFILLESFTIKDVRNLFRLEKKLNETTVKDIRNLFKLKKENKAIKNSKIRDVRTLFEQEEKDYQEPVRVSNFWCNDYIEYESNGDRNCRMSW